MARIRSIKPELRRSLTVAAWPREVRYAWVLLWGYLDDHGKGVDDARMVASDLFPLDRDVSEAKMERWLTQMAAQPDDPSELPPLCRYQVHGRFYLHAMKWAHQKISHPTASRLPDCPEHHRKNSGEADPTGGYV